MFFFYFNSRKLIEISKETLNLAKSNNFEVKGYQFAAKIENLRKPRIVRVR